MWGCACVRSWVTCTCQNVTPCVLTDSFAMLAFLLLLLVCGSCDSKALGRLGAQDRELEWRQELRLCLWDTWTRCVGGGVGGIVLGSSENCSAVAVDNCVGQYQMVASTSRTCNCHSKYPFAWKIKEGCHATVPGTVDGAPFNSVYGGSRGNIVLASFFSDSQCNDEVVSMALQVGCACVVCAHSSRNVALGAWISEWENCPRSRPFVAARGNKLCESPNQ